MAHIVDQAAHEPGHCALTGTTTGPFIDTGNHLAGFRPRVYVSVAGLKALAAEHGMVDAGPLEEAIEGLRAELADSAERADKAERFEQSVRDMFAKLDRPAPRRKPKPRAESSE